jgi:NAD(P)-dependent dehydrogenase (short-subunit alcohol dehydrogenase family)
MGLLRAARQRVDRLRIAFMYGSGKATDAELARVVRGRVVVISGASYGIGEATARRVARCGGIVVMLARSAERLAEVTAEIRADGGDAHAYPLDLTDPAAVEKVAATILREHGQVDVLVNNAGKSIRRSIELSQRRLKDFERTIRINYLGPVSLTLALLPSMREHGGGHVVNVATWSLRLPPAPFWAAYSASKGAFDLWFRTFGQEVRSAGITTTSIYMGLVRTRMTAPSDFLDDFPSLSPAQAAGLLSDAIVYRRPRIEAPWLAPVAMLYNPARTLVERRAAAKFVFQEDTPSSKAAVERSQAA